MLLRVLVRTVTSLLSVVSFVTCSSVNNRNNNVCKTFEDYATLTNNPNCWYNPDADTNPRLIAKRYGYAFERHTIRTEDGYILSVYRISNKSKLAKSEKQPILIHHGLGGVSAFWMLQGNISLAFVLADKGYDVWLANARGTYYSGRHEKYSVADPQFWSFGIHEIGIYDLPATIDYVAKTTGQKGQIVYAGHSLGTTVSLIYLTMRKKHAEENLKGSLLLAPVGYMEHVTGAFKDLAPLEPQLSRISKILGIHVLGQFHEIQKNLIKATCGTYPMILVCNQLLIYSTGYSPRQHQPELVPVFLSYYPSAISIKVVQHYAQIINSKGHFRQFDYGHQGNMELYQQPEPPEYDLKNISLPMHFFVGANDIIGDEQDVDLLIEEITGSNKTIDVGKHVFDFAHNDFFLAKEYTHFYDVLLSTLKNKLKPV